VLYFHTYHKSHCFSAYHKKLCGRNMNNYDLDSLSDPRCWHVAYQPEIDSTHGRLVVDNQRESLWSIRQSRGLPMLRVRNKGLRLQKRHKLTELLFQDASKRLSAAKPSVFSRLLKSAKASDTAHPTQSGIKQSYVWWPLPRK
jgi:hypothetical protein